MVGWFVWGAMDLGRMVEYAVYARWSLIVSFIWLFPLTVLGGAESGMDSSVIGVVVIALAFVFVALEVAIVVLNLRGACLAGCVFATSQPVVFTRTEAGHECREGCHRFRLFLAEVAGEPFVTDAMFKGC